MTAAYNSRCAGNSPSARSISAATLNTPNNPSVAALAKEIEAVVKKNDKLMKVKTAVADGQEVAFDVALKMPTREEAIGRLLALALAPCASLLAAVKSPAGQLVGQLKAIEEKKEENASPPPPATSKTWW